MKKSTFAAMLAITAFTLQVSAKTYYVKADGGNDANTGLSEGAAFATIQKAIDKAAAGSTILVFPGEYGAILSNNKKLTIKAVEAGVGTVLTPYAGEVEYGYWTSDWDDEQEDWVDKWVVEGTTASNAVYTADLGAWGSQQLYGTQFQFSPRKWSSVCSPRVKESGLPGFGTWTGEFGVDWSDIVDEYQASGGDTSVDELKQRAVVIKGVKYPVWRGGSATRLVGFEILGNEGAVAGGTLEHCVVRDASKMAAFRSSLTDCTIEQCNTVYGSEGTFWGTFGGALVSDCTLSRCIISSNECFYISLWSTFKNTIVHRNRGASGDGLFYGDYLINCTIADNMVPCDEEHELVWIEDAESGWYNEEYGNNGYYESTGVVISKSYGHALVTCSADNTIVWNNVGDDGLQHNVGTNAFSFSYFFNSCTDVLLNPPPNMKGKSTGNKVGDPCFIDPANGDYHLAPWSPCVDAGADYTKMTGRFDLDSAARKVGSKVDMGAYEVQPREAVPADYDGDGVTDAAFFFDASAQWWIFKSSNGKVRRISLPDANGTPCPADYDGDGKAEPAYFTAAAKEPEFVRIGDDGKPVRVTFGEKGATPVAAKLDGAKATFGVYTANAKKPAFSFLGNPLKVAFGAKASRPVVADFDENGNGKDDLGVYTATASKPAFSILQSKENYNPGALFNGGPVALGPKGAIPCCADYDGVGGADFGVYMSNTKEPYFQRLFSSSKFRETRTLPMGSKGDVPVVGVYEAGQPAAPAIWTGSVWTYVGSDWVDTPLVGE